MDYTKGRLPNYTARNGSPALMETFVNQTWTIQQSSTGLLTPSTQLSTSPPLPSQIIPQEQLPSSLTQSPFHPQPRQALKTLRDPDLHQQPQPKRLRLLLNATLDDDSSSNTELKLKDNGMQLDREDDEDMKNSAHLKLLDLSTPDELALSPNLHTLPKQIMINSSMNSPAPKIPINNRRDNVGIPDRERNIHDIFNIFRSVIDRTFNSLDFDMSQQNFYEICSFACATISPKSIFTVVSESLHDNIEKICRKLEALASEKVNFLSLVILGWKQCLAVLVKINDLFNPLNFKYIIKETKFTSLFHFGKEAFANMLSTSIKIKTRTILSLTHLISCQRHQIHVGQNLITSTLQIIHENLPVFAAEFGHELIQSTKKFYQKCASTGLNTLDISNYIAYALRLVVHEPTAIYDYRIYIPDNIRSLSGIALEELLSTHDDLLANCFALVTEPDQEQILKALYQLYSYHGQISLLQTAFGQYIQDECDVICLKYRIDKSDETVDSDPKYHGFVSALLELKSRSNWILEKCFDSNDGFHCVLKKGFEVSINRGQASSAQHIASFMNQRLESTKVFATTTLTTLNQCIDLLRHLQGEEVFKCHYKGHLARRLLMHRSPAILAREMDITERLEAECGIDFATDLFVMISEARTSQIRMAKFDEFASDNHIRSTINLNVHVLSGENWSIPFRQEELNLSAEMLTCQRFYNKFYYTENPRNKLTWMANLSSCVVNASYPNCTIKLTTSQYQAMILVLFNNQKIPHWTVKQISQRTGIGEDEIEKSLEVISGLEMQLLTRHRYSTAITPGNNEADLEDDSDVFTYNQDFSTSETDMTLANVLAELPSASIKIMTKREFFNKQERLQASIMKVLKKNKTLDILGIWEQVKARNKNGEQKLLVELSMVETELKVLAQR
ncbi:Cullin family-domain-containing protein [Absidia repens]|uniref:Cullin family-domain-containing protein n=1 Tax=Absidia repens TaxID=90262 RepID=A0A1X2IXT9_9FUNG|nr:Cullin family-domain-containing protein [Absidia repens]